MTQDSAPITVEKIQVANGIRRILSIETDCLEANSLPHTNAAAFKMKKNTSMVRREKNSVGMKLEKTETSHTY